MKKNVLTVKKVDIRGTLNQLDVGESIEINNRQAKSNVIRATVVLINKKDKNFTVTEAGRVDSVLITRTK